MHNPQHRMHSVESIISLLGSDATDAHNVLSCLGVSQRPSVELEEGNADGPVLNTRSWIQNGKLGIEFGFEVADAFYGRATDISRLDMLLTQLYFYGTHPNVFPCDLDLPHGLVRSDTRDSVRRKMRSWEASRRSHTRDTWELSGYRMTVSYVPDCSEIGFVLCQARRPTLQTTIPYPPISEILASLGQRLGSGCFSEDFPWCRKSELQAVGKYRISDQRSTLGLEYRTRMSSHSNSEKLSSVALFRDHHLGAIRWPGDLPFHLDWSDSPTDLLAKLGHFSPTVHEREFDGCAICTTSKSEFLVEYNTIDNWIQRIEIRDKSD